MRFPLEVFAAVRAAFRGPVGMRVSATDWVDGYVARRFGQVSTVGKVLDPVADRLERAGASVSRKEDLGSAVAYRALAAGEIDVYVDYTGTLWTSVLGRKPEDRWTSFSVAKSVTSTLVGAAIKDGKIRSLAAPVTDYIPELKGSGYDGVTVRQLLTMSSGVKWNEDYADPNSDVAKSTTMAMEPGVNPLVRYMSRLPRANTPGTKFNYNTGETDLVGVLVSKATGKTLSEASV